MPAETLASLGQIEDPAKLADTVASHLSVKISDRQALLETLNTTERLEKVLSLIRQMRGGALYQAEFGTRMKGEGPIAQLLGARFQAAGKRLGLNKIRYRLDTLRFAVPESARTALVDAKRDARQMKLL